MSIATITSKGQITLPKDIREKLHLEAGEKIDFRVDEDSGTATLIPLNKSVDDVFGVLHNARKRKIFTVDEMNDAIAKKLKKDYK